MKKLRSTTPRNKLSFVTASLLAVVLVFSLLPFSPFAFARDYQSEINQLDAQISQAEGEIHELEKQANTLEGKLRVLAAEKQTLQSKIDRNEAKRKQILGQIKDNENRLKLQKKALADTLGDMYVDGIPSTIEILASSNNIDDYIKKQQYRDSMNDSIQTTIAAIKELKAKLDAQKKEVETVIAEQKAQRDQLAAKEAERARLLEITRGKEAEYRQLVEGLQEKKTEAEAALAASLSSGSYKVAAVGPVSAGSIVGAVGNTGLSSGPHLHLEVRQGGSVTDPGPYIQRDPINMPPGYVSQSYGNPDPIYYNGYHPGTDYATGEGAPIFAIDSGYMYRGCSDEMLGTSNNAYGYVAIVEHSNGTISVYAHMSGGPAACNYNTYY